MVESWLLPFAATNRKPVARLSYRAWHNGRLLLRRLSLIRHAKVYNSHWLLRSNVTIVLAEVGFEFFEVVKPLA